MLLKVFFLLLIVYLALRAISNLFRAIWNDPRDSGKLNNTARMDVPPRRQAPPARAAEKTYEVEVEDARWVDVEQPRR